MDLKLTWIAQTDVWTDTHNLSTIRLYLNIHIQTCTLYVCDDHQKFNSYRKSDFSMDAMGRHGSPNPSHLSCIHAVNDMAIYKCEDPPTTVRKEKYI